MFFIKNVKDSYFVGCEEDIVFRNKKTIIKKIEEFYNDFLVQNCENITEKEDVVTKNFAFELLCKNEIIVDCNNRSRNYPIYTIKVDSVLFNNKNEAILYLDGLINSIILAIKINCYSDEDNNEDDSRILDIIK